MNFKDFMKTMEDGIEPKPIDTPEVEDTEDEDTEEISEDGECASGAPVGAVPYSAVGDSIVLHSGLNKHPVYRRSSIPKTKRKKRNDQISY